MMTGGTPTTQVQSTPTSDNSPNQSVDPLQDPSAEGAQGEDAQCPADPLEAFRQALRNGDADEAWSSYTTLDDSERSQLTQPEISDAVGLFEPNIGLAAAQQVFGDFCIELLAQLEIAEEQGILDAELADTLVNGPGVTADEQKSVTEDDGMMSVIHGLVGADKKPHEFFAALAAQQNDFVKACAEEGPLADWVGESDEILKAVVQGVPDYTEWSNTFEAHEAWDRVLKLAADDAALGALLRAGIIAGSGYGWIVAKADKPIEDDTLANGLFEIYGDGTGIADRDKRQTWDCLYTAELHTSAGDFETWHGDWTRDGKEHDRWKYYHSVQPNGDAMNLFFETFKPIPRVQVNLASHVLMCDYRIYKHRITKPAVTFGPFTIREEEVEEFWEDEDKNRMASRAAAEAASALGTSYYNSTKNAVLMRSTTSGGTPDTDPVLNIGQGPGRAPSAANREFDEHGNPVGGLRSYFENHAAHEIGHAVGNKRLQKDGINTTGDNAAKSYAAWQQNGSAVKYARQLGWTSAMDATSYNLTVGATTDSILGVWIRLFLVSQVGGANAVSLNPLNITFGANAMAAVNSDATLAAHTLTQTVNAAGSAGRCFRFLRGIPSPQGGKVHFFSTRWDDQWVTYNHSAWNEKVSHYSVSSYKEMFAEIYTQHYAGGSVPAGMQSFFNALDNAEASDFPDNAAGGGGAGDAAADPMDEGDSPWPS